jgi:hypothetical protein
MKTSNSSFSALSLFILAPVVPFEPTAPTPFEQAPFGEVITASRTQAEVVFVDFTSHTDFDPTGMALIAA